MLNRQGRETAPGAAAASEVDTFTGNRGLALEEPLIFEIGDSARTGVDLPAPPKVASRLAGLEREPIGLPGLSEPEAVRHYTRLSRQNFAIDMGLFPLGSCTMKHNPRLNEKMARLPGFSDIHPLQPVDSVQGALELIAQLANWLKTLTGMPEVSMSPKAGAHGELCGMLAIRAAHEARGEARKVVLVPESAHGTNPATAAVCGYEVETIPATPAGRVDLAALLAELARREINEVHVEAGAVLNGALLTAGLVDELLLYLAPCLVGDAARGIFSMPALASLADKRLLTIRDTRMVGADLRVIARVG